MLCVTLSLDVEPAQGGSMTLVTTAAKRQLREVRTNLSSKARVTRMLVSAGLGAAAGLTAQHCGTPYPHAVFVSYAVSEVVDKTLQVTIPRTRSLTPDPRGPWAFAAETLTVSAVAGLSAAALQYQMEPFTHTLLGRATPGVIGIGAGAMFPRILIRGTVSLGVSVVTRGVRSGIDAVRRVRRAAHSMFTDDKEGITRPR